MEDDIKAHKTREWGRDGEKSKKKKKKKKKRRRRLMVLIRLNLSMFIIHINLKNLVGLLNL